MQPPVPSPKSSKPEAPRSWRPTFRPFLSKRPAAVQISSLLPFAASLKPGRYHPVISVVPEAEPTRGAAPTARAQAPVSRWRSVGRLATLSAAALIIGGTSFVAGKNWTGAPTSLVRRAGTPTLKPADDGGYVRWHNDAVDVVIDKSFSDLAGDDLFGAALDAWRASGAALPSVSTIQGEKRKVGYDPNGPNENVVVYAPQGWAKANGALAITVLTYDNATGHIVDADLLVNGGGRYFKRFETDESSASDDPVNLESGSSSGSRKSSRYDIQSVVTHELGHFFGLGEDFAETEGTMYVSTRPGETHKRVLKPSDAEAVTIALRGWFRRAAGTERRVRALAARAERSFAIVVDGIRRGAARARASRCFTPIGPCRGAGSRRFAAPSARAKGRAVWRLADGGRPRDVLFADGARSSARFHGARRRRRRGAADGPPLGRRRRRNRGHLPCDGLPRRELPGRRSAHRSSPEALSTA